MSLEIYNMRGIKVDFSELSLTTGSHLIMKDISLSSGQYIIVIKDHEGLILDVQGDGRTLKFAIACEKKL